jgi:hypothetical protein
VSEQEDCGGGLGPECMDARHCGSVNNVGALAVRGGLRAHGSNGVEPLHFGRHDLALVRLGALLSEVGI